VRTGAEGREVIAMLGDDHERQGLIRLTWEAAERQLTRLADQGLRWGVSHGDPSHDNIHVSEDGLSLYGFDLAGPGWQVEDLTGASSTSYAEVFLEGYTAVRRLLPVELEALPWLRIVGTIENLHFHVIGKPAVQGTYSLAEGWVDRGFEPLAAAAAIAATGRDVAGSRA